MSKSNKSFNLAPSRILIVGDVMLDEYWHGSSKRISPEAPVPVVHVTDQKECPGGAGNVALNCAALGMHTTLIGFIGKDEAGKKLHAMLKKASISPQLITRPQSPTIRKCRILSKHQQLIRLDFENLSDQISSKTLLSTYKDCLKNTDIVILSDYSKGVLDDIETLISLAKKAKIPILIDPKHKEISRYQGATVITPNLEEFQNLVGPCPSQDILIKKAKDARKKYDLDAILITQGEKGMTLIEKNKSPLSLPAQTREVYDVTGAGDTVIATLASVFANTTSLSTAMTLANQAAGLVVAKLGAATVSADDLRTLSSPTPAYLTTEAQLIQKINHLKAKGKRIVMTNGCFDLLHAGHLNYLEEAKALGDHLIIAVNDDASVKTLKGPSRPLISIQDRLRLLAALECVDSVIAFSESTPQRLIKTLMPDILVKGGDYKIKDIAGSNDVLKNGGEVKILPFIKGYSTSAIVEKIQASDPKK